MGKRLTLLTEFLVALCVIGVVIVVTGKYFHKDIIDIYNDYRERQRLSKVEHLRQAYVCPQGTQTIKISGGKVCRKDVENTVYRKIFDTYSFKSTGKEQVYSSLSSGDIRNADKIIQGYVPIDRYDDYKPLSQITWSEDPYQDRYWRFLFYGFRPFQDLFFAFDKTGKIVYLEKVRELTNSFLDLGSDKPESWEDYHAVSFRAMTLVKSWWQLRSNNLLSYELNEKILKSLATHADFLADPNHYQKGYNHGLNESAALYLISTNFPDLPNADQWLMISTERLDESLTSVVDQDGVLIENSPYYHFYTLEKYWEIYHYSRTFNAKISENFNTRLSDMISYATYILQPNSELPLLGASLKRRIYNSGIYKEIAEEYPEFKFVLTQGKEGEQPQKLSVVFPESGEVVMRSDWGNKENFLQQTQVIFDAGPYRTDHSDLDALSFSLFGNGNTLMPDAGLYSYEEGSYRDYFHGTASHNTIIVDDLDQEKGTAIRGEFIEQKNFVSQSAVQELNKGVIHNRSLSLIGEKYVLIIDNLSSNQEHVYKQLFHIFPGADIEKDGTTLRVYQNKNSDKRLVMTIYQLLPKDISLSAVIDQTNPPRGLCSEEYDKIIPCYSVEYEKKAYDTRYITLIEIGDHDKNLQYSADDELITIIDSNNSHDIFYTELDGTAREIKVSDFSTGNSSSASEFGSLLSTKWTTNSEKVGGNVSSVNETLVLKTPKDGKILTASLPVHLNLNDRDLQFKVKVTNRQVLDNFTIALSTDSWKGYVTNDLKNSYREEYDGEWLTISVAKGKYRTTGGQWRTHGEGFSWSNIDGIRIQVASTENFIAQVEFSNLSTTPSGNEGEVIIVFDDGYESILPAVEIMKKNGMKGNIAVIGDVVEKNMKGYLSLSQLKKLKDEYGWNLVNHSQHHKDALDYFKTNDLKYFENDLIQGAQFLTKNNLNTTPNWYVYPHGATNDEITQIISKYYKYARTTINQPEASVFGDNYRVKTISADGSEASNVPKFTSPEDLMEAVRDAQIYKYPLFITFHRIESLETDKSGYKIEDFEKVIDYIASKGIPVKTLNQFDQDNGVEQLHINIKDEQPGQIQVKIRTESVPLFTRIRIFFNELKESLLIPFNLIHN